MKLIKIYAFLALSVPMFAQAEWTEFESSFFRPEALSETTLPYEAFIDLLDVTEEDKELRLYRSLDANISSMETYPLQEVLVQGDTVIYRALLAKDIGRINASCGPDKTATLFLQFAYNTQKKYIDMDSISVLAQVEETTNTCDPKAALPVVEIPYNL